MLQVDIRQMQALQTEVIKTVRVCYESNAEIFCHKGGDGILIGGFTDNVWMDGIGFICAVRKPSQTGVPVISNDWIMLQITENRFFIFREGMSYGCDDDHFLKSEAKRS